MAPQGTVSFPGIPPAAIIGADYTLGHGITPGVCNLRVVLGASVKSEVGDLVFRFGDVKLTFPQCALRSGSLKLGGRGHVWSLQIADRRWKWQYGAITGQYNIRGEDGKLDSRLPEKTPQELAKLLLEAMKEKGYDVSALPNEPRPEISWDAANPAGELAELCESLGCRVVLGTDDKVRICRTGEGRELPDGGLAMNAGLGLERTIPPDELQIIYGPSVYQSKLRLEAVGEETDGSIEPIDKLSYIPEETKSWVGGPSSAKDEDYERDGAERSTGDLAEETVFRMYRIVGQVTGGLEIPGLKMPFEITGVDQYVLRDDLIETLAGDDGVRRTRPAYVAGVYYDELADDDGNTKPGTNYPHGFRIDTERRLVLFDQPVYKLADGGDAPADLHLMTSYHLRVTPGGRLVRDERTRKLGGARHKTGPRVEHHPEIFSSFIVEYDGIATAAAPTTNREETDREADYYLDALERQYKEVDRTSDVQYAGLVDICPDGAIQQVNWRVGDGGPALTRASRNTEANFYVASYAEKRRRERAEKVRSEASAVRKALADRPRGLGRP
jgi:hypothetical protein